MNCLYQQIPDIKSSQTFYQRPGNLLAVSLGGVRYIAAARMNYDFNQDGVADNQLVKHGNVIGWFDDTVVGNHLDTLGMMIDFNMGFQILFGYNNRKILFRWRNGASWENFYVQGSR